VAFPTDTFTAADLDVWIPEIWGERVNEFYKKKLVMADFFTDRSSELSGGGDVLHTPNVTEMAANAKVNAQAVTLNSPTDTKIDLTVDQWFEVSFAIEDRQAAQVKHSYVIMKRYASNAGYAIANKLEVAIATLFSGFSQTVGASTTALADSDIRAAIALLEEANIDPYDGDTAFFLSPAVFWKQVQNLDKFSLAINSPSNDPSAKRPTAHLYGIPVFTSNNIQYVSGTTGRYNALAHRDAIHWATSPLGTGGSKGGMVGSKGIRVQSNYIPEYLSTLTTADIVYGVIENRDTNGVKIVTPV
jgi:hypothetical protein